MMDLHTLTNFELIGVPNLFKTFQGAFFLGPCLVLLVEEILVIFMSVAQLPSYPISLAVMYVFTFHC